MLSLSPSPPTPAFDGDLPGAEAPNARILSSVCYPTLDQLIDFRVVVFCIEIFLISVII
jgi:hypothetical protein